MKKVEGISIQLEYKSVSTIKYVIKFKNEKVDEFKLSYSKCLVCYGLNKPTLLLLTGDIKPLTYEQYLELIDLYN